jgi:hypothetical protein
VCGFFKDLSYLRTHLDGQILSLNKFLVSDLASLVAPTFEGFADHRVNKVDQILPRQKMLILLLWQILSHLLLDFGIGKEMLDRDLFITGYSHISCFVAGKNL